MNAKKTKAETICRCNSIEKPVIEDAIRGGCQTLNEIFDSTDAGVGACGGSCRKKLLKMLEQYQKKGTFPETFIQKKKRK